MQEAVPRQTHTHPTSSQVFVANPNKPAPIRQILFMNKDKLVKFLKAFHEERGLPQCKGSQGGGRGTGQSGDRGAVVSMDLLPSHQPVWCGQRGQIGMAP